MLDHDLGTYPRTLLRRFLRRLSIVGAIAFSTLCLAVVANAQAPAPKTNPLAATDAIPTYPDSPEGLKKLIADIFAVIKTENDDKAALYFKSLAIADHADWFASVFGAAEGPQLDAKYQEGLADLATDIRQNLGAAVNAGRTDVAVAVFQKPLDPKVMGLERAVVEAMVEPIRLYVAYSSSSQARSITLGQFFYVQGGFRYADSRVLMALSTAPPPRAAVAGLRQQAKLTLKIDPVYPEEAKAAHIAGTVSLRAIIGTDGFVKELKVVRGDPILAQAALDAVRLWLYEPTVVNGKPVEVETAITLTFRPPLAVDGQGTRQ